MGDRLTIIEMAEKWGLPCPFPWRGAGSPSNNIVWAKVYLCTKWHLDPSSRLATIDMGLKLEADVPFCVWGLGPHLTECALSRRTK